ncbi:hypothetical protein NW754_002234 [Fusarium falciforme]|nr:hypothetical protein NW754_002234 [Fusarium falciforme]
MKWCLARSVLGVDIRVFIDQQSHDIGSPVTCSGMEGSPIVTALSVDIRASVEKQSHDIGSPVTCSGRLKRIPIRASLSVDIRTSVKK